MVWVIGIDQPGGWRRRLLGRGSRRYLGRSPGGQLAMVLWVGCGRGGHTRSGRAAYLDDILRRPGGGGVEALDCWSSGFVVTLGGCLLQGVGCGWLGGLGLRWMWRRPSGQGRLLGVFMIICRISQMFSIVASLEYLGPALI